MTIASEITRLQGAKADIRTSIQNKGVTVPASTKLDGYPALIDNINTGLIEEIFVPKDIILSDNITNRTDGVRYNSNVGDTATADSSVYYHYVWVLDPDTTAHDTWYMYVWSKTAGNNPIFTKLAGIDETNGYYYSVSLNKGIRMKKVGNDQVKVSSLISKGYWKSGSGAMTSCTWYCLNATNTTSQLVTLVTNDTTTVNQEVLDARTASCGITAEESIPSMDMTSISIYEGTKDYLYDVKATINI